MYASRAETNLVMKAQTEQMKATNENIADIEAGLQSANKCMLAVGVLVVIVAQTTGIFGKNVQKYIDCALEFTKMSPECKVLFESHITLSPLSLSLYIYHQACVMPTFIYIYHQKKAFFYTIFFVAHGVESPRT